MNLTEYKEILLIFSSSLCYSNHQRKGQALYNAIREVVPDIADEIRGTTLDPFFTKDEEKLLEVLNFLDSLVSIKEN